MIDSSINLKYIKLFNAYPLHGKKYFLKKLYLLLQKKIQVPGTSVQMKNLRHQKIILKNKHFDLIRMSYKNK